MRESTLRDENSECELKARRVMTLSKLESLLNCEKEKRSQLQRRLPMQANPCIAGIIDRPDMEDFPIGSIVKTPSGRVGTVVKHRGAQSRHDLFQRIIIEFDEPFGDSVALQPHLLKMIGRPEASS